MSMLRMVNTAMYVGHFLKLILILLYRKSSSTSLVQFNCILYTPISMHCQCRFLWTDGYGQRLVDLCVDLFLFVYSITSRLRRLALRENSKPNKHPFSHSFLPLSPLPSKNLKFIYFFHYHYFPLMGSPPLPINNSTHQQTQRIHRHSLLS